MALLRPAEDGWSAEDWLAFYNDRLGIAEFDGGLPREKAEAHAFACCVVKWLNRNAVRSPPGRCHGCGQAEHAHDSPLPFGTESTGWPPWSKLSDVSSLDVFTTLVGSAQRSCG